MIAFNYWLGYLDLVVFFKCLHGGHIDLTRSCSGLNLKISNNRTSIFRDFYFNRIAILRNNILDDVRQAESTDSFKRKL